MQKGISMGAFPKRYQYVFERVISHIRIGRITNLNKWYHPSLNETRRGWNFLLSPLLDSQTILAENHITRYIRFEQAMLPSGIGDWIELNIFYCIYKYEWIGYN